MDGIKKVVGLCSLEGSPSPCAGKIHILKRTGKNVYASWHMHDLAGGLLAGVSRNYFIEKDIFEDEDVLELILVNILQYRIMRKRVFSSVEVIEE